MVSGSLQLSGTTDSVGVPINQKFDHGLRIKFRRSRLIRVEIDAQFQEIQPFHKGIIDSNGVFRRDIIFDAGRQ